MKKIKILIMTIILFSLTGCFNDDSMEDINIVTSAYPIQYVVNTLYGDHSTINSIYPSDSEIINFEVTDVLLEQYSNSDLFIFNGVSNEKDYVEMIKETNKEIKIIDTTEPKIQIKYSIEELWLDPNNLLTMANNIKKGFNEYIKSAPLKDEVNTNYEKLKIELTNLDGNYYSNIKNSNYDTIIVSDDAFKYLEKYDINVISLDPDTSTQKEISNAKESLKNGDCTYIYIKYGEETSETINNIVSETNTQKLQLYTMTNLKDININKSNYLTLMNENLEQIKLELYK